MNVHRRRFSTGARCLAAALLAAQIAGAGGCATNPVTGKKEISLVSRGQELQMGQESDPAIIAEYGLYNDQEIQNYVNGVGQKIGKVSHLPNLTWHFRVLDSPVVNAFAVPGGYIYITRGILAYLSSEAQLAGVLGHEVTHVTARHSAQQITRTQLAGIGLLAGAVFVEAFRPYSGIAQQGLGLLFLKYGRDDENEADDLGIQYTVKANYDPREIPPTYATLKRIGEKAGASLPAFLSTHPDPGDRETRTTQLARAAYESARRDLTINATTYRGKIEGIVYGDDPRSGYFLANRFYHPELRFQMIFPQGWKTANQPSAILAANEAAGAAMQVTLANTSSTSMTPADYVANLKSKGEIVDASGRSENFRDYPAWLGTIRVNTEGGARDLLAAWVRLKPGQFLQLLGQAKTQSAADQFYAATRSIATLTESSKINVTPDRIAIKSAPKTATFSSIWSSIGGGAIGVEDAAILNGTRATTTIQAGTPIKTVKKGVRPA